MALSNGGRQPDRLWVPPTLRMAFTPRFAGTTHCHQAQPSLHSPYHWAPFGQDPRTNKPRVTSAVHGKPAVSIEFRGQPCTQTRPRGLASWRRANLLGISALKSLSDLVTGVRASPGSAHAQRCPATADHPPARRRLRPGARPRSAGMARATPHRTGRSPATHGRRHHRESRSWAPR